MEHCHIVSNIGLFSIVLNLVLALPDLRQQKMSLLTSLFIFCIEFAHWRIDFFLYSPRIVVALSSLLHAIAKSKRYFLRARKSDNYRQKNIEKKQRTTTKNTINKTNRKKNISIAILKKFTILQHLDFFSFWGHQ